MTSGAASRYRLLPVVHVLLSGSELTRPGLLPFAMLCFGLNYTHPPFLSQALEWNRLFQAIYRDVLAVNPVGTR